MDFGALPPEINSARMYAGPGSGPMLAAASAWDALAAELDSAGSTYSSVVSSLAEQSWLGPASASMAAAAAPYVDWMSATATEAEQTGFQAKAAAAAYEAAFTMTVPPAEVAANRTQLAALVATNVLGQNTAAIAATEALYGEMWAQDAAAMYGYAGSSAAAATVTPFSSPPQTTNEGGAGSQAGAVAQATGTSSSAGVQSTLSQVVSTVPNSLQQLASPVSAAGSNPFAPGSNTATTGISGLLNLLSGESGSAFGSFITSGFANGILSGNWFNPASIMPAVTSSFGDIGFLAVAGQSIGGMNPALFTGAAAAPSAMSTVGHVGSAMGALGSNGLGGSAVSAGMGRATLVGTMSVPHSWAPAPPVASPTATASPAEGWYMPPGVEEASATPGVPGMPGMPMAGGTARGWGFAAPRYGFKPTVVAHPPAAG
ncbi:PPE family protein [Mycobacterium sp.]|jgi:PPE-repeat protein|uniref:PPE family protein n=1 Tax=Mycobacterium sp. TaxID=1785 RepID=UPI002D053635|nr:PPE family protein [Mycobacterium sp.]HXB85329.1 PPE family protein [Mycobacterium sp.]